MSDPAFTSKDFTRQITGTEAELEIYSVHDKMLYFSLVKNADKKLTLDLLTASADKVEFGTEENGNTSLGKYTYRGTDKFFFRFPKDDMKIDSSRIIRIDLGDYFYTVSVSELADFSTNRTVYGGDIGIKVDGPLRLANHGALVGVKNEPSLKRLAAQIIGSEKINEKIAQMLLGFVNKNIAFSDKEAEGKFEILKRPNEVIMTKNSDCSGLTILFASLLEQTDIDYRLVYYTGHISVAVAGNFPIRNGLSFETEGKKFFIAETTTKNFKIGESKLAVDIGAHKILHIQRPSIINSEVVK